MNFIELVRNRGTIEHFFEFIEVNIVPKVRSMRDELNIFTLEGDFGIFDCCIVKV